MFPLVRRFPALLLLALIATFLGLAAWDGCEAGEEECPPTCHLACVDGCGVVTPAKVPDQRIVLVALEALVPDNAAVPSLAAPRPELSPPRA